MAEPWVDGGMDGGAVALRKNDELGLIAGSALQIARRPFVSETESDLALLIVRLAELQKVELP